MENVNLLELLEKNKPLPMLEKPKIYRMFFRCNDCLASFAIEGIKDYYKGYYANEEYIDLKCLCTGSVTYMGTVKFNQLVDERYTTPCDHRCTDAPGNNCECSCGGINHGTHKVVKLEQYTNIPIERIADIEYGNKFRADMAELLKKLQSLKIHDLISKKRVYVERDLYFKYKDMFGYYHKIYKAKTKKSRNEYTQKCIAVYEELKNLESTEAI